MKKLLSIILALALTASLAACDSEEADEEVKMPDVSSESEALTYEEAIEPFAVDDNKLALQEMAQELYERFLCILRYYYDMSYDLGVSFSSGSTDDTITTTNGIADDMNAISEYLDSCDQYVTAASEISNAVFRDAYISFSDSCSELYYLFAERDGVVPTDGETMVGSEEATVFTRLSLCNMVLQASIIDSDQPQRYLSEYTFTVEYLFTAVEMYCRFFTESNFDEIEENVLESDTESGFYWRALDLLMYLDGVDLSCDASEIDISYITSTLGSYLAYKPNIEAIEAEAYEGDSQKQAQLDDFFEAATKLYNTLVATPPSFGDESYIEKNEFDVDVIEELVKKINE